MPAMASGEPGQPWEYSLRKYLLLLATLVATVTYAAGFNPPGGVWQDTDPAAGRLAGDPIIRNTDYRQYLVFFYCNATAFASSLVVIVLILILAVVHEKNEPAWSTMVSLRSLRVVMVLNLLSLMGAYGAGTCRDTLTTVYSSALVAAVFVYLVLQMVLEKNRDRATAPDRNPDGALEERLRKVLMLLATFAVSVTYVAGLSAPGGFWDHVEDSHLPGDAMLKDRHDARLKAFFLCNTTTFVASLFIIVLLLDRKLRERTVRSFELYGCIVVALIGLVGAYAAGSCRKSHTTFYVVGLVGAVLACIAFQAAIRGTYFWRNLAEWLQAIPRPCSRQQIEDPQTNNGNGGEEEISQALEKARSLVLLLATLAATITYQAGLDPPGGLWQDDRDGHKAGDPILLTTNARRYNAFFYCNSIAFVASLIAIILVQKRFLLKHNVLEAAMILDLFGLIGAYAAGSCRDVSTSIYAMALAGAVLVYVVIHVVFFTLDHKDDGKKEDDDLVEKRRKRLLLFAILAATITYQAGLTPPSGFRLQDDALGHYAGDPVLLYNYPRRYKAFFYCNSVSFMLSIALIILLVNPNLYRPAIRSYALSVCTAAGLFGLMGAYAAGSTQHLKTSIYIFALVAVVLFFVVLLLLVFLLIHLKNQSSPNNIADESSREGRADGENWTRTGNTEENPVGTGNGGGGKKIHAKRKYLMLLGILVASVTYQAGLEPPGGVWQSNSGGHAAGNPVMNDNRRPRYLAFFYSNSTSFVASIVVIVLLLLRKWKQQQQDEEFWLRVMNTTIVLDLLGLLGAYAAGSTREWKTSGYVVALVFAVLAYIAIHVVLSCFSRRCRQGNGNQLRPEPNRLQERGNGGHQAQRGPV